VASLDFRDFYIRYQGHPRYKSDLIIEDDIVSVMIQKYEMILFTNQGEVLGLPDFGCNLEDLLFQTKVSSAFVEDRIRKQITTYIPELDGMNYRLSVSFARDYESYQEAMFIYFVLADYEIFARIGDRFDAGF